MPFVSTISGAWPVLEPDLLPGNVEGAVAGGRHLQLREARGRVGVQLEPGRSGGGSVLDDQPCGGGGGRVADAQHPGEALGLVGLDLQHLVIGGVDDSRAGGAALQAQVHLPKVGNQGRGSNLGGGPGHARHRQPGAQRGDPVDSAVDRQKVVSYPCRDGVGQEPRGRPGDVVDGQLVIAPPRR